jgi:2'-5' RNA ligase
MRLFTAIDLPEEVKNSILEKSSELAAPGINLVKKEALHLTFHFFGERTEDDARLICKALSKIKWSGFSISLEGIGAFNSNFIRVIFVKVKEGSEEVVKLYKELSASIDKEGIPYEKEQYIPHITIARVKFADRSKLLSFIEKYKEYNFGSFKVESFYLIKSTLTSSGPIYEKLYEFKP